MSSALDTSEPIKIGEKLFGSLGPGLITGVSDDDPSGIATYSQVGAQFGYGMLWTLIFSFPLMVAIQEISARIGCVTGRGIAGNIRRQYSSWVLYPVVFILTAVNTINLGADLQAMGAALNLIIGGPESLYCLLFAIITLSLEVLVPYALYVHWLKWLTFALFAYVGTVWAIHVPWAHALSLTFFPSIKLDADFLKMFIAVLGTTISPYLFFWQASQEVEEQHNHHGQRPLGKAPSQATQQIRRIKIDTYVGMGFSNLIAFFIMLTTAATLNANGVFTVQTAAQAAEALRPVAGRFCFLLFSFGIIGSGMLAIPVLAGSAAYGISEAFSWKVGLGRSPSEAKGFYSVIAIATLVGLALTFLKVNPIQSLIWSAVLNGIIATPIMAIMMLMTSNPKVMGMYVLPSRLKIMGWIATIVMFLATIGLLFTSRGCC
ncbi:MAG: divalent metal cation transporter [Bdellovibrionia bacterium]